MQKFTVVLQPHYKTETVRVAMPRQQADVNYVAICCSPSWNGVWKWTKKPDQPMVMNGKLPCYVVPLNELTFVQPLEELKPEYKSEVKRLQNKWYKSEIKNRNYEYSKKPEWML